ncbi:hypothetical protein GDO81_008820 [Engystomops pustulosus]|uniref:Uncharacterized protein n=1 Tax=Engystomops pustulosus TaxID=76066 RepID=A0AAV7CIB2_ENGPU|nr:hypothetical protein GDO81_008820 [Engystomops pustulosus]
MDCMPKNRRCSLFKIPGTKPGLLRPLCKLGRKVAVPGCTVGRCTVYSQEGRGTIMQLAPAYDKCAGVSHRRPDCQILKVAPA